MTKPKQLAMPVSHAPTQPGPCRWCGQPGVGMVEVEGPRWRVDGAVRVIARRALEVPACHEHISIVERQETDRPMAA